MPLVVYKTKFKAYWDIEEKFYQFYELSFETGIVTSQRIKVQKDISTTFFRKIPIITIQLLVYHQILDCPMILIDINMF